MKFVDGTAFESTPEQRFESLIDLPPSAKLVYTVLSRDAPLTQAELREETLLSGRTLRDALTQLRDADIVAARVDVLDARRRLYATRPVADSD